jgi:hypothetical protein
LSHLLLGRYDVASLTRLFEDAGVLSAVVSKGFSNPLIKVVGTDSPLAHVQLHAAKQGRSYMLFDGCVTQAVVDGLRFDDCECRVPQPVSLLVIFWAREQDPTAQFRPDRPRLPLQDYPGLGVIRRVFRVGARMAVEMGKDGLGAYPKLPHDAIMFFRSRLFLFLHASEQGRLDAMWRDLGHLGLRDFSLAVTAGAVRDAKGRPVSWQPGLQVHPLSEMLCDHFHSAEYSAAVDVARTAACYTYDSATLTAAVATFERSLLTNLWSDDVASDQA